MGILILWLSSWFVSGFMIYNLQTKKRWVLIIGGGFITSLFFIGLSTTVYQKISDSSVERATASIKSAEGKKNEFALKAAHGEILEILKAPATANVHDMKILKSVGDDYVLQASVDSQNTF